MALELSNGKARVMKISDTSSSSIRCLEVASQRDHARLPSLTLLNLRSRQDLSEEARKLILQENCKVKRSKEKKAKKAAAIVALMT